jgi:YidC/Oxa1 family membrane protein insertase
VERQALIAALLCLLVLLGYQAGIDYFYPPPPQVAGDALPSADVSPGAPAVQGEDTPPPLADAAAAAVPAVAVEPGRLITIDTDLYTADVSSNGGRIVSFRLKDFRTTVDADSEPLEMIALAEGGTPPLGVRFQTADGTALDDTTVTYAPDRYSVQVTGAAEATVTLTGELPGGGSIQKILQFTGDAYPIMVTVRAPTLGAGFQRVGLGWRHYEAHARAQEAHYQGAVVLTGTKLIHQLSNALATEPPQPFGSPVGWAGYTEHYFTATVVPENPDEARAVIAGGATGIEIFVSSPRAEPTGTRFTLYVGPKDLDLLSEVGHELDRVVDFGWFSFLAVPLLRLLKWFHHGTGNYGIDIILLTILVKMLFMPLTNKSMKSMRAMQRLQPEMTKLRERFKDDRERLNKEMIELYRRHRVNPLGGCLPMLLQFPVFIGLYQGLYGAIELRHASFAFWVRDLSTNECYPWPGQTTLVGCNDLSIFGMPIPVLVLFMGGSMILQQWLTPATGMDPTQQRMMMILMPIMFTVMFVTFPSGLVLYWLVNNVLTIGQQYWTNRQAA